jgi:serine/threonine protein kinase
MGEVYLAEDTHAHRPVAIKVIHKGDVHEAGTDTFNEALRLFRREMRAISRLSHSYILPLLDYGEEDVNGTPLPSSGQWMAAWTHHQPCEFRQPG